MDASTPKTSSGKLCKKCLKKGSPCHLHTNVVSGETSGGTSGVSPSRKSVKSSKPQKSPTKKQKARAIFADQFEHVPLPALEQILLNLNRKRLHRICISSRQVAKVCRESRFQKLYDAKHPPLIVGELHLIDTKTIAPLLAKYVIKRATFHDDVGNKVEIYKKGRTETELAFVLPSDDLAVDIRLSLIYGQTEPLYFGLHTLATTDLSQDIFDTTAKNFLVNVGKTSWIESIRVGRVPKFKHVKEFYNILKTNIQKAKGGKKIWDEIVVRPPEKRDYKE